MKKMGIISAAAVIVIIAVALISLPIKYNKAVELMESGSYDKAIRIFTNLGAYKDSEDIIKEWFSKKLSGVEVVSVTDGIVKVKFGNYTWRVLDIQSNSVMLITDEEIAKKAYNNTLDEDITWEKSTIRQYLNNEFYNTFSEKEKAMIKETNVVNSNNPKYGTSGGNNTKDKVFLLSIGEVNKYFISDKDMIAYYNGDASLWWLRSPGSLQGYAAYVCSDGGVYISGYGVYYVRGVRPALNLEF